MKNQVPKYVTQARAAFLLSVPEAELSRISKESGLGRVERAGDEKEAYFAYEELERICLLAARHMEATRKSLTQKDAKVTGRGATVLQQTASPSRRFNSRIETRGGVQLGRGLGLKFKAISETDRPHLIRLRSLSS